MKRILFFGIAATWMLPVSAQNLFPNPDMTRTLTEAEYREKMPVVKKYSTPGKVPVGFGVRLDASSEIEWGITSRESFRGKNSCYFKFLPDDPGTGKKFRYNFLVIGSDGWEKTGAIPVKPNTKYCYSYRIKGTVDVIDPCLFFWPESDDRRALKVSRVGLNRNIPCTNEWQRHAGTFQTGREDRYASVSVTPQFGKAGDCIYLSDIVLMECPAVVPRKKNSRLRVAVYDADGQGKKLAERIRGQELTCEVIDTLKSDKLKSYDVLVLPSLTSLTRKDRGDLDLGIPPVEFKISLLNFADCGGGIVMDAGVVGQHQLFTDKMMPRKYGQNGRVGELSRGRILSVNFAGTDSAGFAAAVRHAGEKPKFEVHELLTEATLGDRYLRRCIGISGKEKQRRAAELAAFKNLPAPQFQEKIIWIDSTYLSTEAQIAAIIANCRKMGFSKILIQANKGYFLFYRSAKYPDSEMRWRKQYNIDVLDCAARHARKLGMKFGIYVIGFGQYKFAPGIDPEITHADRILLNGGTSLEQLTGTTEKAVWGRWMCSGSPSNQKRFFDVLEELIQKFHPDEIHFDYVRYSRGYELPCECDRCLKAKQAFHAAHPEISADRLDAEFARDEMTRLYTKAVNICKKCDPSVITSCYTMSSASMEWIYAYPFDRHYKYVSTTLGPAAPLSDVRDLAVKYNALIHKLNPKCQFVPILSAYDYKEGVRRYTEFALLFDTIQKLKMPPVVVYYHYAMLTSDRAGITLLPEIAPWMSKALNGELK